MTDAKATVDGPLAHANPSTVERVFVGIPDVLQPDQVIRLQSLDLAIRLREVRFERSEEDEDAAERTIRYAEKFESYIATGDTP